MVTDRREISSDSDELYEFCIMVTVPIDLSEILPKQNGVCVEIAKIRSTRCEFVRCLTLKCQNQSDAHRILAMHGVS